MDAPFGVLEVIETHAFNAWDEWRGHVPDALHGAHQSRINQWILSRAALEKAFERAGVTIDRSDLARMEGHKALKQHTAVTFSLSHTEQAAAAWVCEASLGLEIGLDIEATEREISEKVARRIQAPGDVSFSRAIELFSAKEAVFKSIPNEFQEGIVLPKIQLSESKFTLIGSSIEGHWRQTKFDGYVCTFAWVKR